MSLRVAHEETVRPEWIDANGHMNLAYYVVIFDHATDVLFEALGVGDAYRRAAGRALFAAETHTLHDRELAVGEGVRVAAALLGADAKRLHVAHEMHRVGDGVLAARQEIMFLHVDLGSRRVVPFGAAVAAAVAGAARGAAPPAWTGRRIALPG